LKVVKDLGGVERGGRHRGDPSRDVLDDGAQEDTVFLGGGAAGESAEKTRRGARGERDSPSAMARGGAPAGCNEMTSLRSFAAHPTVAPSCLRLLVVSAYLWSMLSARIAVLR
jgi:hypothetical protein